MRVLGVLAALLFFLTTAQGGDADKETKALQGKWQGKIKDKEDAEFTIEGKKWSMKLKGKDGFGMKGTFTVDTKVLPHTIDLKIDEAMGEDLDKFNGKTSLGIYELKGDTLRLTAAEPGREPRPNEFVGREGQVYVEFRRLK